MSKPHQLTEILLPGVRSWSTFLASD